MTVTPKPVRRVITGFDTDGNSIIEEDGTSSSVRTVPERPGYIVNNMWVTGEAPSDFTAPDVIGEHVGVNPPKKGTVLRIIEFPPEPKDPEELDRQLKASFGQLFSDAHQENSPKLHPGMHQTDTVDYAIIIAGEIVAIMDKGETLLKAGDVLVQRGTNHAWANRSDEPCRIAFVLIDAKRV